MIAQLQTGFMFYNIQFYVTKKCFFNATKTLNLSYVLSLYEKTMILCSIPPILICCTSSDDTMTYLTSVLWLNSTHKQPNCRSAQYESGCRLTDMLPCFLSHDRNAREKARIRKEVDNRISAIQHEIQVQSLVTRVRTNLLI